MQQIIVEGSKHFPTGIHPHGVHVIVRLGLERAVRILFHAKDGRYTYGTLTAPPSHSIARVLYSSVVDLSTKLSQIAECLVGVIGFT